jgi:hypothetical protein
LYVTDELYFDWEPGVKNADESSVDCELGVDELDIDKMEHFNKVDFVDDLVGDDVVDNVESGVFPNRISFR